MGAAGSRQQPRQGISLLAHESQECLVRTRCDRLRGVAEATGGPDGVAVGEWMVQLSRQQPRQGQHVAGKRQA